ncbi:hypothetical protein GMORB2_6109 [Geosmithia morbida]|uniref:Uncharacterized protein n=1 Tax=Geosmithia morbida TaxID=1094350 RepID=A0A9P5D132_9HYPO|nr:uncharacterized protein GMORB2_6109 [Geosmithia morbida]KAF4123408.1 hypothetical protein GMORB2_6109 [Geosmithia morbida]
MDLTRDFLQIGQNPSPPRSPDLSDELFETFFDLRKYFEDRDPSDKQAHLATPQHLNELITGIRPLIDSIESHPFLSMGNSFGSDDEATASPGYSSHPSPPELVQGEGSTSPSEHSGPTFPEQPESYKPHAASLQEIRNHDDQWTYPQAYSSDSPASTQHRIIHHDVAAVPSQAANRGPQPGGPAAIGSQVAGNKRPRQLENPDQTADVRKSGACLPCRISKTRCHENGVCPACRKAFPDHSHMVCGRKSLVELWPAIKKGEDFWASSRAKEAPFLTQTPRVFTGKPKPISVFFSRETESPALSAYVQPYRWQDEDEDSQLEKAAFCRDYPPKHEELQKWVENRIQHERGSEFPQVLQRFLMAYSREGSGLPKHRLVQKVHQMSCFFRIWKTPSFWCRDPTGKIASLPISVQAQLRAIALRGISSVEHDVLKELDGLTTPSHQPGPDDKLAVWASMWQLILIYREMTAAARNCLSMSESSPSDPHSLALQSQCRFFLDCFFPQVTIFYHYQFRNKKSLEVSLDWLNAPKYASRLRGSGKGIEQAGKAMIDCRKKFLQTIQSSDNEVDRLLCVFVVNHELKKLNARKRTSKPSSKSKSSARDEDDDCGD